MINRIIKNYITTIIGAVIIGATIYLVYNDKTTVTESTILITLGGGLIVSKDTLFRSEDTNNGSDEPK
jgi:general stress protein CsbA